VFSIPRGNRIFVRCSQLPKLSPIPFRINTCKSMSKQSILTIFRMNTYEKTRGEGALSLTKTVLTQVRRVPTADTSGLHASHSPAFLAPSYGRTITSPVMPN
jgi:hypothetical protein